VGTGFAGGQQAGCFEEFGEPGFRGTGEVDLGPAPSALGTYNVVAEFFEEASIGCESTFWRASASTGYPVIAKVTVAPNEPTNKEQCKKGGWKGFTDANGAPFKNQGQCVKFVETRR
jgi:hypothetical protein